MNARRKPEPGPGLWEIPTLKVQLVHDSGTVAERTALTGPSDAVALLRTYLGDPDREHMVALLLDVKHRVNGIHTISIGALASAVVEPREVFKAAILANSAALILAHNHPSGDPTPSAEDIAITHKLQACGALLGIPVLDHLVLGRPTERGTSGWVSLKTLGHMGGQS